MLSLENRFIQSMRPYAAPIDEIQLAFDQIYQAHTAKNRYYHNLNHLDQLLQLSDAYASYLSDSESFILAIYYHDIVYNAGSKNNEESSAKIASSTLSKLNFPSDKIRRVQELILATKSHECTGGSSTDTAFFIDFDLSILGTTPELFQLYCKQIRKEFQRYPDFIYRKGRLKFVESCLVKKMLYCTELGRQLWEEKARTNLQMEKKLLFVLN